MTPAGTIKERISEIMKASMKSGDKDRLAYTRNLHAAVRKKEIDDRKDCTDDDVIKIIQTLSKQRVDSIEQFRKGGREDLVANEEAELQFLKSFLPEAMSEDDIRAFVQRVVDSTGATSSKDMGKVMKGVMELIKTEGKGLADGKVISKLVSEKLR